MRRIPRLRRPSGLTSTTSATTSRIAAGYSHNVSCSQQPALFCSSSQSSTRTLPSHQRPTAPLLSPPRLARFYSSEKPPPPSSEQARQQETVKEPEQELDRAQAQAQAQEPAPIPTQAEAEVLPPAEETELSSGEDEWTDLGYPVSSTEGAYTAPPERLEAARPTEVADPKYIPATTAQGLRTVGGINDWWRRAENWAASGDFESFRPKKKITDTALLEAAVRQAVIETLALRQVGRDEELVTAWPNPKSEGGLRSLLALEVKSKADGSATLGGDAMAVADGLRQFDEYSDEVGDEVQPEVQPLTSDEATALSQTWDPSWKSISLTDARIRFAVTKRVFQLTGQLVPDHKLPSLSTVHSLLSVVTKPPKPPTLSDEIQINHQELTELPNVTFAPKRVTRGHKEEALGRLKLMQAEFRKRGLPLEGHGYAPKGRELERLKGGR
ncbi:ribosomal subunit 39S-domain-containing protein [Nemania sp. FL0916]|nr:ribosomal subunit 39S-domain-containing protein [Nemania sp. FL0916]